MLFVKALIEGYALRMSKQHKGEIAWVAPLALIDASKYPGGGIFLTFVDMETLEVSSVRLAPNGNQSPISIEVLDCMPVSKHLKHNVWEAWREWKDDHNLGTIIWDKGRRVLEAWPPNLSTLTIG